jgi:SAM-dependent methyltransferase
MNLEATCQSPRGYRERGNAHKTLRVLELATEANFFMYGYLLANADVARYGPSLALAHLQNHGLRERRKQVTRAFFVGKDRFQKDKFGRFSGLLRGDFSFLGEQNGFPINFSANPLTIGDYPRDSSNEYFGPFVAALNANPQCTFLDIGCGLREEVFDNCLYLDVYPSPTADVVVPTDCLYPLASSSFDGISCCAVLEHVTKPWVVVDEIHRLLKPGGRCYIDWPFLQPVHGYPSHFYNATREGLRNMFADRFCIEKLWSHQSETPDFSIAWLLGRFAAQLGPDSLRRLRHIPMGTILDNPGGNDFWKPFIEELPPQALEELACGNSLIARKI